MEVPGQSTGLEDGQQNLNDLQNYLVHFNKEIEVAGDTPFQHNVSQILTQSVQPVYVSVPVSSETSTPDEEQLPVISEIKAKMATEALLDDSSSTDGNGLHDNVTMLEMCTDGPKETDGQLVSVDSSLDGLSQGTMRLQEISPEQVMAQGHLGFTVSDGVLVLPMGDAGNVVPPNDSHLVQIVNINGQPTLQIVDPSAALRSHAATQGLQLSQAVATPTVRVEAPSSSESGEMTEPVSVLASVATSKVNVNQDGNGTQLVALRSSTDGSQPQVVAVPMDNNNTISSSNTIVSSADNLQLNSPMGRQIPGLVLERIYVFLNNNNNTNSSTSNMTVSSTDNLQLNSPMVLNPGTGYQSVAIMTSDESGQPGEVNYVLIVNQANTLPSPEKDNIQPAGLNVGDVTQQVLEEAGIAKHFVKINQILGKQSTDGIHAIPVGDQLMCSYCNYTSNKRYLLSRHIKSHSDERPHKCTQCQRGFKTLASLQNHINTHTGYRPHPCKLCDSRFTTSGELVRHIRYKHTFEKPHKCTECDYASVELSKLKRHIRSHTGERPYKCVHCNYASPDTYKLKRHMRIHTGEKPYACDVCNARFTQSNSLKAHKLIHSGNKPVFQCSLCPATCGRKTDLRIHMMKQHSSDSPLECKRCGKTFPDKYTLKVHAKSHDGEKCFKCNECDYAATSQRQIMSHMLTHTNTKPYSCDDCNLSFRQKQLLKRHRELYHSGQATLHEDEEECKACEKAFKGNTDETKLDDSDKSTSEEADKEPEFHTCGGTPKSNLDSLEPLTADQLIENSLLADMKEGKLGISPKVVVVHPDGRVEEVTAKLQSLSQSKPMDDFLVSLGVTGEGQFDQDGSLNPDDLEVTSNSSLVTPATTVLQHANVHDHSLIKIEPVSYSLKSLSRDLDMDQKEESTQASFESEEDETRKMKILGQEQLLRLAQGVNDESVDSEDFVQFKTDDKHMDASIQQMFVSVLQVEEPKPVKRNLDEESLTVDKRLKLSHDVDDS